MDMSNHGNMACGDVYNSWELQSCESICDCNFPDKLEMVD